MSSSVPKALPKSLNVAKVISVKQCAATIVASDGSERFITLGSLREHCLGQKRQPFWKIDMYGPQLMINMNALTQVYWVGVGVPRNEPSSKHQKNRQFDKENKCYVPKEVYKRPCKCPI